MSSITSGITTSPQNRFLYSCAIMNHCFCKPENFYTKISHQLFYYKLACFVNSQITTKVHKFKRGFCTQHPVLSFFIKDFWYTKKYQCQNIHICISLHRKIFDIFLMINFLSFLSTSTLIYCTFMIYQA